MVYDCITVKRCMTTRRGKSEHLEAVGLALVCNLNALHRLLVIACTFTIANLQEVRRSLTERSKWQQFDTEVPVLHDETKAETVPAAHSRQDMHVVRYCAPFSPPKPPPSLAWTAKFLRRALQREGTHVTVAAGRNCCDQTAGGRTAVIDRKLPSRAHRPVDDGSRPRLNSHAHSRRT